MSHELNKMIYCTLPGHFIRKNFNCYLTKVVVVLRTSDIERDIFVAATWAALVVPVCFDCVCIYFLLLSFLF